MSDEKISLADGSAGAAEKRREGIMKGPLAVSSCHCRYGKLEVPPEKKRSGYRGVPVSCRTCGSMEKRME